MVPNNDTPKNRGEIITKMDMDKFSSTRRSFLQRLSNLIGLEDFIKKKSKQKYFGKRKGINIIKRQNLQNPVWKKNFFIICFFVSKFTSMLKVNLMSKKFKKLNQIHFEILGDKSHSFKESKNLNLNEKLISEYTKIIESSHTSKLKIKIKMFKFCNKFKFIILKINK